VKRRHRSKLPGVRPNRPTLTINTAAAALGCLMVVTAAVGMTRACGARAPSSMQPAFLVASSSWRRGAHQVAASTPPSKAAVALVRRPLPSLQRKRPSSTSSTTRAHSSTGPSLGSSFQPLPPPEALGTPVFPDVDLVEPLESSKRRNANPSSVFVVTGASRGIGLQAVRSLLDRTQGTVVACCRRPNSSPALLEIQQHLALTNEADRLQIQRLDLEDQDSIEEAGEHIRSSHSRLEAVFHVAGILGDNGRNDPGPERSASKLDRQWMEKTMAVNAIGPMMLNKELLPLLTVKQPRRRSTDETVMPPPPPPSIVVHVSARVGSISDNRLGGWYSYRMSKSALNQGTRTLALELKRHHAHCISYHPGTTQTDLSQPFASNVSKERMFPVEFSVDRMLAVADAITADHSGGFYDWAGKSIPF
jgi:NAD(P)-dependent dehydrogenase (short-subunit alcohol dehydrogenase family)